MKTFIIRKNKALDTTKELNSIEREHSFVPNFHRMLTHSQNGLKNYCELSKSQTSLSEMEKLIIGLVVSQTNQSHYWLSYLTQKSKKLGLRETEIIEFRLGNSSINKKLNALAKYTRQTMMYRGTLSKKTIKDFFSSGWSAGCVMDINLVIGQYMIANFVTNAFKIPIDFPWAPNIAAEEEEEEEEE